MYKTDKINMVLLFCHYLPSRFLANPGLFARNFRAFLHDIDRKINWEPVYLSIIS